MKYKQLAALFVCNLVPFFVGNALLPLLPIYAGQMGVSASWSGVYLAFASIALTGGALFSGWISDRFQRRKLTIIISGVVSFPGILLMSQAADIVQLTLVTMVVWFMGGLSFGTVSILTGLATEPGQRGRTFGIIGMTLGLGAIIGGLLSGRIADQWGYEALFGVVSLSQPISIISALFLEDRRVERAAHRTGAKNQPVQSSSIMLLIAASVLANAINSSGALGRPLRMNTLAFDATAISSTAAAAGFITLPLPFLIGWLSDRVGRRRLLIACYLSASVGILVLAFAQELWQFWLSTILLAVIGSSIAVGSALITDVVPRSGLDTALARFSSTPWIGAVLGFGGTGFIVQTLGNQITFILAAFLPIIAIVMLRFVRPAAQPAPP